MTPHRIQSVTLILSFFLLYTSCNFGETSPEETLLTCGFSVPDFSGYASVSPVRVWYIDSRNGNDANDGLTPLTPWRHLAKIHSIVLAPGDAVRLARGSVFSRESILFNDGDKGASGNPVIIESYGTGDLPRLTDPRTLWDSSLKTYGIRFSSGSEYIRILGLSIDNTGEYSAILLDRNTRFIEIIGCGITRCGEGIWMAGNDHTVMGNRISDCGSTGQGSGLGIVFFGSRLEICWNIIRNCRVKKGSRQDGGALEYYNRYFEGGSEYFSLDSDIVIHHNLIDNNLMFLEAYGNVTRMLLAYNVYLNGSPAALMFHFDDCEHPVWTHECTYWDVKIENNTFVTDDTSNGWGIIGLLNDSTHPPNPAKSRFIVRNNAFDTAGFLVGWSNPLGSNLVHDHNLAHFRGNGGFCQRNNAWLPAATEQSVLRLLDNISAGDFRLADGSPGIDEGLAASFSKDVLGNHVPSGSGPDIGAYERVP